MQPFALDKPSAGRDLGNVRRTSPRETEHHPLVRMSTRERLAEPFTQESNFIWGKSWDRGFLGRNERHNARLLADPHVLQNAGPFFFIEFERVVEPGQSTRIGLTITGLHPDKASRLFLRRFRNNWGRLSAGLTEKTEGDR